MSQEATLSAESREGRGKGAARRLRGAGRVPAILYGRDMETVAISVDAHDAERLFQRISVENTIVDLSIDEAENVPTLVREIQVHPFRPDLLHIDFYRIQAGVKVDVSVPVNLEGVPAGVKMEGGTLQQVIYELPIKVLPSKIPNSFSLDVSGLEIGDSIHVYDMDFDEDIEVMIDDSRTVCTVAMQILEVEEEEPEEELELLEGELPEGEEAEGEGEAEAEADDEEEDDE